MSKMKTIVGVALIAGLVSSGALAASVGRGNSFGNGNVGIGQGNGNGNGSMGAFNAQRNGSLNVGALNGNNVVNTGLVSGFANDLRSDITQLLGRILPLAEQPGGTNMSRPLRHRGK